MDVLRFLESEVTNTSNFNVLVLCDLSCLEDFLYQVTMTFLSLIKDFRKTLSH